MNFWWCCHIFSVLQIHVWVYKNKNFYKKSFSGWQFHFPLLRSICQDGFDCLILGLVSTLWMPGCVCKGLPSSYDWSIQLNWLAFYPKQNIQCSQTALRGQIHPRFSVTSWQPQRELDTLYSLFIVLWSYLSGYFILYLFTKYLLTTCNMSTLCKALDT